MSDELIEERELTEAEIARRSPVWVALSDLWLDNELQEYELVHIANVLLESGYDLAMLERIMAEEVAPVVYMNAYSVTGLWNAFDADWLCARILELKRRRDRFDDWLLRAKRRLMTGMVQEDWQLILRLLRPHLDGN